MQKASCEFCRDRLDFVFPRVVGALLPDTWGLIVGEHSALFRACLGLYLLPVFFPQAG